MFSTIFTHDITKVEVIKSLQYSDGIGRDTVKIILTHEYKGVSTETEIHTFAADKVINLIVQGMKVPDEESGSKELL